MQSIRLVIVICFGQIVIYFTDYRSLCILDNYVFDKPSSGKEGRFVAELKIRQGRKPYCTRIRHQNKLRSRNRVAVMV